MKLNAIVIDDEAISRDAIKSIVNDYCSDINIIDEAESVSEAILKIEQNRPDFIFLDIDIKEGTGFDVLSGINTQNMKVIFVTGFNDYAIKAFKFSAIDYILKPINPLELVQAINKVRNTKEKETLHEQLNLMQQNRTSTRKKIALPTHDGLSMVWIDDIIRCEADNSYTSIFCNNGKRYVVSRSIKEYDELFSELNFLRIHQSHLINLQFVSKFQKEDGGLVIMDDEVKIPVARRRKEKLMESLMN